MLADKHQLRQARLAGLPQAVEVQIDAPSHRLHYLAHRLAGQRRETLDAIDIVLVEQLAQRRGQLVCIDLAHRQHEGVEMIVRVVVVLAMRMVVIVMIVDRVDAFLGRRLDAQQHIEFRIAVADVGGFDRRRHARGNRRLHPLALGIV